MSYDALFQLGMDSGSLNSAQKEEKLETLASNEEASDQADHFITKNGVECAGAHLIIDLYEAEGLDDIDRIDKAMRKCVEVAGATLLHIHLHPFEPNGGISGVAVLAESHISIHSWPERGYAALDVFMCGDARPELCVDVLREAFSPRRIAVEELLRGKGA